MKKLIVGIALAAILALVVLMAPSTPLEAQGTCQYEFPPENGEVQQKIVTANELNGLLFWVDACGGEVLAAVPHRSEVLFNTDGSVQTRTQNVRVVASFSGQ